MKVKKQLHIAIVALMLFASAGTGIVRAEGTELSVTGNGAESSNQVSVSNENNTTINQDNNANINNNVTVNANTGDNSASGNTGGDASITTGDISSNVGIENSANQSTVNTGCCPSGGTSANISGNGYGSSNNVSLGNSQNTNVNIYNNATINNSVYGTANTGGNTMNWNTGGNSSMKTGDIWAKDSIKNGPINVADATLGYGMNGGLHASIEDNGSYSWNVIHFLNNNNFDIDTINHADIVNNVDWDLNTGNNKMNWNTGNVDLVTGDIVHKTSIENGPINVSSVKIVCCEEKEEKPVHEVAPAPEKVTVVKVEESKSEEEEAVLGAAAEQILPVTGFNWFFLAALGSVLMLLYGLYLRLRSGNSPGTQVAY